MLLSCLVLNREGVSETTLALPVLLFCLVLNLEGVSETTLSAAGLPARTGSAELSRDMPGSPLRPENTSSPPFVSSLLLLYAAFPTPLSAVWRKYDGSRAPSDAAIWSRESWGSSTEASRVWAGAAIDIGLPAVPRDVGLCCHFMVFERVGIAALGEGLGAASEASAVRLAAPVVDGALSRLIEPKPLNSGTSPGARWGGSLLAIAVSMVAGPDGVNGGGEPSAALVLLGVLTAVSLFARSADVGVSGCAF